MDLKSFKEFSDRAFDFQTAKKNELEKTKSRQVVVYNGRIFSAEAQTICLVSTLKQLQKQFYMLDKNNNPVMISDPDDFLRILIEKNQETLNSYHSLFERFKQKGK